MELKLVPVPTVFRFFAIPSLLAKVSEAMVSNILAPCDTIPLLKYAITQTTTGT